MITIKTNSSQVLSLVAGKLRAASSTDAMLRACATNIRAAMKHRIHVDGIASDGNPIGQYSDGYMVVRTGAYQNAKTISKGKNKGKRKDAGTFTSAVLKFNAQAGVFQGNTEKLGKARPRYNRTDDPKVIISLTRQMENDLVITPTLKGYGIGYNNKTNFQKVAYVESTYKKKIFRTTKSEQDLLIKTAAEFHKRNVNAKP